jgi:LmbE family N-acetylglucosaminyl deacetylase
MGRPSKREGMAQVAGDGHARGPLADSRTRRARAYDIVCLSPHFDDAVLSCGGLLHRAVRTGHRALAVTICAAPPPADELSPYATRLHARWGADSAASSAAMVARRRSEDEAALARLGVAAVYLDLPDAIYRRDPTSGDWLYAGHAGIFGPVARAEAPLTEALGSRLVSLPGVGRRTVCLAPLAAGGHVDHRLVRRAAESAWGVGVLRYYEDYPYAAEPGAVGAALGPDDAWRGRRRSLDAADVDAKLAAVACYASQISTFWADRADMEAAVRAFATSVGRGGRPAERLWRRGPTPGPAGARDATPAGIPPQRGSGALTPNRPPAGREGRAGPS